MDQIYKNEDNLCDCRKCEKQDAYPYVGKYQRLPRTVSGALGLCPKINK